MRGALLAVLMTALALSGCASKSPGSAAAGTADVDTVVDATGKERVDEAPSDQVVDTSVGKVAANKGLLAGRVHDGANFSISGATVDVLGTQLHGKTDSKGSFRFDNVTPGVFDVRVEAGGFTPVEQRVTIKAGAEAILDITLTVKPGLDPGLAPHIHDYWAGDTEWTLMDATVPLPERLRPGKFADGPLLRGNAGDEPWPFMLPEQDQGRPATIWPGTRELRFTLSWGTEPENTMPAASVLVQNHHMSAPLKLTPVANGGTASYALPSSNHTDLGHATGTKWQFWLNIENPAGAGFRPTLAADGIHVKVVALKGDLVLEAAHRDFWAGNATLAIGDWTRDCVAGTGAPPSDVERTEGHPQNFVCAIPPDRDHEDAVNIIPPGTKKIQVRFAWDQKANTQAPVQLPFTYHMTYRTAAMSAAHTPAQDYRTPVKIEEGTQSILYEIELQPGDADGFYQGTSSWGFKWTWDDAAAGYQFGLGLRINLQVTAFKDPAY